MRAGLLAETAAGIGLRCSGESRAVAAEELAISASTPYSVRPDGVVQIDWEAVETLAAEGH